MTKGMVLDKVESYSHEDASERSKLIAEIKSVADELVRWIEDKTGEKVTEGSKADDLLNRYFASGMKLGVSGGKQQMAHKVEMWLS